jgi:hypothetical protein
MNEFDKMINKIIDAKMKAESANNIKLLNQKFLELQEQILASIPSEMDKKIRNIFTAVASSGIRETMGKPSNDKTSNIIAITTKAPVQRKKIVKVPLVMTEGQLRYNAIKNYQFYKDLLSLGYKDVTSNRQQQRGTICMYDNNKYTYTILYHDNHLVVRTGFVKKGRITGNGSLYKKNVVINPSTEKRFFAETPKNSNFYTYNLYHSAFRELIEKAKS